MMYNAIFALVLFAAALLNGKPALESRTVANATNDTTEIFKLLVKELPKAAKENKWELSEGYGDTIFLAADAEYAKYLKIAGKTLVKTGDVKYMCDCAIKKYDKYPQILPYIKVGYFVKAGNTYIVSLESASVFPLLHKSGKYKGVKKPDGTSYDAKYAQKMRCEISDERQRYIFKFRKTNNTFNLVSVEPAR